MDNNISIEEGNKLIAEFMQLQVVITPISVTNDFESVIGSSVLYRLSNSNGRVINQSELQYHTSWDWLMPAVEKILFKSGDNHAQLDAKLISALSTIDIKQVWFAVIDFIKWFNENKK